MITLNTHEHAIMDLLNRLGSDQHLSVKKIGQLCWPEAGEYDTEYAEQEAKRTPGSNAKSKSYRWAANGLRKLRRHDLIVHHIDGYSISEDGVETEYRLADGQEAGGVVVMSPQEIKALLSEKKLTIARLAQAADMKRQRVSDVVSRGRAPRDGEMRTLTQALKALA